MFVHANAALSLRHRERLVRSVAAGLTITAAAQLVGCSRQTASKWVGRQRRGEGLADRSSRPHRPPPPRRLSPQPDPARTRPALRTRTARRALTHRRQAARAHPTAPRPPNRPALRRQRQSRLGLPVRLRRRQNTARSLRLLPARNNRLSPRLPQRLPPLLPPTRNRDRRSPHRQRQMLPTHLERQLPRKRHQTAPHPHGRHS